MSLAATSSIVWCTWRPLIAANIPLIISGSLPFRPRLPCAGPASASSWLRSRDHGAVDVCEDLLLHVLLVDCGDHGPVGNRDHERGLVDEDERVARSLGRSALNAARETAERGVVEPDAAALDALQRV